MNIFNFVFFATSLFAALPPLAQSSREIQALIADPHMQSLLGSAEMIQEIIHTSHGYIVRTTNYELEVSVHYLPAPRGFAGPAKFELEFHLPTRICL